MSTLREAPPDARTRRFVQTSNLFATWFLYAAGLFGHCACCKSHVGHTAYLPIRNVVAPFDDSPGASQARHLLSSMALQADVAALDAFQLIRRKRPRSADSEALEAAPQFGSLATSSNGRALMRPVLLPAISHLLACQNRPLTESTNANDGVLRQRISDQGEFIERRSNQEEEAIPHEDDEDDVEGEDKSPWPSAMQYQDIFAHLESGRVPVYDLGLDPRGVPLHPEFIYSEPVSCMYFLKCARLLGKGSFGFPRKKKSPSATKSSGAKPTTKRMSSKEFEWRKMSFVTGLPKKQPVVRYITATCYSRATDVSAKKKVFRMHAVMLADADGVGECGDYVLVHIRAGGSKRVGLRTIMADPERTLSHTLPSSPTTGFEASPNESPSRRPVSPPFATVTSYNSQTTSTSPQQKKLLQVPTFSSEPAQFGRYLLSRQSMQPSPIMYRPEQMVPAPKTFPSAVDNVRQVIRDLILQSCHSRDEMHKYVLGLQEELAALQHQSN